MFYITEKLGHGILLTLQLSNSYFTYLPESIDYGYDFAPSSFELTRPYYIWVCMKPSPKIMDCKHEGFIIRDNHEKLLTWRTHFAS